MKFSSRLMTHLFLVCLPALAQAALVAKKIEYKDGETVLEGYLVYDDKIKGKRPGVLVVHEWWGHNEHARNKADELAKLGYTAFALDMYGKGKKADHPKDAKAFSSRFSDSKLVKSRFNAAQKVLAGHKTVNDKKVAAIGYCFGGRIVLEMARAGADLKAVAVFHGSLGTGNPAKKGVFKAQVLVATGADDKMIPSAQVEAFRKEMKTAGVTHNIRVYKGAMHSFTNPAATAIGKKFKMPVAYNADADKDSWKELVKFLKTAFK